MSAGIHVWPGIREALEHTFEGWPNCAEYDSFCNVVRAELAKEKRKFVRDVEGCGIEQSLNPQVARHFKKFVSYPGNPIANPARKLK